MAEPPVFDGPRFALALRNHMDSKEIQVQDVVERTGMSRGVVQTLRRGTPGIVDMRRGQKIINPRINTLAAVVFAIDQRFSFVMSWAGLEDEGERFTPSEKRVLADLLGCQPEAVGELLRTHTKAKAKGTT